MIGSLFNPMSVCLLGVSADQSKMAGKPLVRLMQHHFGGEIYLVNPKYDTIDGRPCFSSVTEIGKPIDVALISLPASKVPDAVRECGAAGVKFAVVISSGFGEDPSASELTQELMDAVASSDIRLVGPNCEGIWSMPANMALTFGSAADRPELIAGGVSVISQSGSIGGACMRQLQDLGIGCRYFVSSGNEADLTSMDYLEYLVEEGESSVVAMFLEGIRDGHRLPAIARAAALKGIRLIALSGGTSETGRLATASHTGRIASASAVYRDIFVRSGVLQVETFTQFVEAIEAASFGQLPPIGESGSTDHGVSIVAMSGGSRALLADACARRDVPLATYSESTENGLDGMLPQFGYSKNPTDLTGQVLADPPLFSRVLQTVINDPHTEAMIVQYANGAAKQLLPQLDFYRELAQASPKPIIISLLGRIDESILQQLHSWGILCVSDPEEAVEYLGWLYRWRDYGELARQDAPTAVSAGRAVPIATWSERMEFLDIAGIAVPRWKILGGEDSDPGDLRYPVVLKALPDTTEHKSDLGLVFLRIGDAAELADALTAFRGKVPAGTPALVQEMATSGVEVLLTARDDPDFGPVLAIGSGGVMTEWLNDIGYVPLPTTRQEVRRAIAGLRLQTLLEPFRGRPAADVEALVDCAMNLARSYLEHTPRGSEVELNPVIITETGAVAVDMLGTTPPSELAFS